METKVMRGWESSGWCKVVETSQEKSWNVHSEPSWKWLVLPSITLCIPGPRLLLHLLPCTLFSPSFIPLVSLHLWPRLLQKGYSTFSTLSSSVSKVVHPSHHECNICKIQVMPHPYPKLSLCQDTECGGEAHGRKDRGSIAGTLDSSRSHKRHTQNIVSGHRQVIVLGPQCTWGGGIRRIQTNKDQKSKPHSTLLVAATRESSRQ